MKKISLAIICLLFFASSANSQTRWMRLHPDVSWKYLAQWESEHQWLTPARIGKLHFQKHEVGRARQQLEAAVAEERKMGGFFMNWDIAVGYRRIMIRLLIICAGPLENYPEKIPITSTILTPSI